MSPIALLTSAAAVTIAVETAFLALVGYRTRLFLTVCALINLATNLTLNLGLSFVPAGAYWSVLSPAEVAVVIVEWAVLRLVADHGAAVPWRSRASGTLLAWVFLGNLLSFSLGPLLFW